MINNGPKYLSYYRIRGHKIHFDTLDSIQMEATSSIVGKIYVAQDIKTVIFDLHDKFAKVYIYKNANGDTCCLF